MITIAVFLLTAIIACQQSSGEERMPDASEPIWERLPSGAEPAEQGMSIGLPPPGSLYHGVFPGGKTGDEDDITPADVSSYENTVSKQVAWVYFSDNWFCDRDFPLATAQWIRERGSVPFIRLMLMSGAQRACPDPTFTLERIIGGDFDPDLAAWAASAMQFGTPLIVEYGTEVNGDWFPWSGAWNGGGETAGYGDSDAADGPERYRDAYRHIVKVMRGQGATNITWVFHANGDDWPERPWNRMEEYYPGDEWVDWIGVSAYGPQQPLDDYDGSFRNILDDAYPRLASLGENKPLFVLEFGVTSGNPLMDQADWAQAALEDLLAGRWPRVAGFSWWNETWVNDDDPAHDTDMRVQDNATLAEVFKRMVGDQAAVVGRPLPTGDPSL